MIEVWTIQMGIDNTDYQFVSNEAMDNIVAQLTDSFENFKSISSVWNPPLMIRKLPKRKTDFFEIDNSGIIAISEKAKDIYEEDLENVEFLQIETDSGFFYAINILEPLDCLDLEKSVFTATDTGRITSYKYLDFYPSKLKNMYMFRIPEFIYTTFVTYKFQAKYSKYGLCGLEFDVRVNLVWND